MNTEAGHHSPSKPPRDLAVLLSVFAFATLGLAVLLAIAVQYGGTRELDVKILQSVRRLVERHDTTGRVWAEESVIAITSLGSVIVLSGLSCAVGGLLLLTRRYQASIFLVATLLGALAVNYCLKAFFARARPDAVAHLQRVTTPSFPSGHALIATAVYGTLGAIGANLLRQPRLKIYIASIAVLLSLLIGLSRIYLGVHYPSDVLAGWAVGLLWAIVCWFATRHLQLRGELEQPK